MVLTPSAVLAQTAPDPEQTDDAATAPNDAAATADEVASPLETGDGDNEIIVTGSRIARPEIAFPNPITSFTSGVDRAIGRNGPDCLPHRHAGASELADRRAEFGLERGLPVGGS